MQKTLLLLLAPTLISCGGPLVPSQEVTDFLLGNGAGQLQSFRPNSIPGCNLWFDGRDPNGDGTHLSSGTSLSLWKDKSGKGNDVQQSIPSNQPVYNDGVKNGNGAVFFGVNQYLQGLAPPTAWTFGISPKSVYFAFNMPTSLLGLNHIILNVGDGVTSGGQFVFGHFNAISTALSTSQTYLGIDSGGSGQYVGFTSNEIFANSFYLLNFRTPGGLFTGGSASINGFSQIISALGGYPAGGTGNVTIGVVKLGDLTGTVQMNLLEVISYDRMLTSDEDSQVRAYLSQKWGI